MALSISRQILRLGAAALIVISADAAYAERGGNGNSSGNRGNSGNNHGAIASELKNLNAANASQTGLENANSDSLLGLLLAYQLEQQAIRDAEAEAELAEAGDDESPIEVIEEVIEESALAVLTGGRELTEGALGHLNNLLGLN